MNFKDVAAPARTDELPGRARCPLKADRSPRNPWPQGQPAAPPKIPVPPYDRELPPSYWDNLPRRYPNEASYPARARGLTWVLGLAVIVLVAGALAWVTNRSTHLNENGYSLPPMGEPDAPAAPIGQPAPQRIAPRAALVKSPPRVRRAELVVPQAGNSYWVQMPDGRKIVINYMGELLDKAHLPVQHGITNAAYHTLADNSTWIWTVPVGASNIPEWIDP